MKLNDNTDFYVLFVLYLILFCYTGTKCRKLIVIQVFQHQLWGTQLPRPHPFKTLRRTEKFGFSERKLRRIALHPISNGTAAESLVMRST